MSSIFAMTQDAQRRVEKADRRHCSVSEHRRPIFGGLELSGEDTELILLLVIMVMLASAKASPALLLAIMYVIM